MLNWKTKKDDTKQHILKSISICDIVQSREVRLFRNEKFFELFIYYNLRLTYMAIETPLKKSL